MKNEIKINKGQFLGAVSTVVAFAETREGDFVNSITMVDDGNGRLSVKATDYEQTIIYKEIEYKGEGFKPISLDGKKLSLALKAAKTDEVTIAFDEDFVTLKSGRSRAKINIIAELQEIDIERKEKLDFDCLSDMKYLLHSIDSNNPKYELNGLLLDVRDGNLHMVSTDTRRMSILTQKVDAKPKKLIIPKKSVSSILKLFSEEGSAELEIEADEFTFSVFSPTMEYSTKLINGRYPDYERIIPKTFNVTIKAKKKELLEAINEASIFQDEIDFSIKGDKETIISDADNNTEVSMMMSDIVLFKEQGKRVNLSELEVAKFRVQARYFHDYLSSTDEEEVELGFNEYMLPIMFQEGNDIKNFKEIIMVVATA